MSTDKPAWPWTTYKDFPVHRAVWDKKRRRWTTEDMPKDVAEKILNSAEPEAQTSGSSSPRRRKRDGGRRSRRL